MLEVEKTRRLVRVAIAIQKRLLVIQVERGVVTGGHMRRRLAHPNVAGYILGLASDWCDSNDIESVDPRCWSELQRDLLQWAR